MSNTTEETTTMNDITLQDVLNAILGGVADGEEKRIIDALNSRRSILSTMKATTIRIGDTVRFNDHARPKYLVGLTGEVEKVNSTTVTVRIGAMGGRFANSAPRCPVGIVDIVEES